jgi:predicted GTPase
MGERRRIVIMGAGGRDFHLFNTVYRDDPAHEVVAITATQIPGIDDRKYPPVLSGPLYPDGIEILPESEIETLIKDRNVDEVVFAYSDVNWDYIAEKRAMIEATGAAFSLFEADPTMIEGEKPCIAICAVRTGCGKSALSRYVTRVLKDTGLKVAAIRHPMPYGKLHEQVVQRFAKLEDLKKHDCTIEEMEEYEPHISAGNVVFAGADYGKILAEAEKEADIIIWDGGNNDTPFYKPDLWITIVDPLRAGHELTYFPGKWNLERADVLVINKVGEATEEDLATVRANIAEHNPKATVVEGYSPVELEDPDAVRGKRVLVIEDGPTTTHGGMGYGAGYIAAKRGGAAEIVDPRPYVTGEIADAFQGYPHLEDVLPALGYGEQQLADLEATIERVDCDVVVVGTPIDLSRILTISKPSVRVAYGFEEKGSTVLADRIRGRFAKAVDA